MSTPYRDEVDDSFDPPDADHSGPASRSSQESTSTTSLILERIHPSGSRSAPDEAPEFTEKTPDDDDEEDEEDDYMAQRDLERGPMIPGVKPMEKKVRRMVYIVGALLVGCWLLALAVYLSREAYRHHDDAEETAAVPNVGDGSSALSGKKLSREELAMGLWSPQHKSIEWIDNPDAKGEDGWYLSSSTENFIVLKDVANISYERPLVTERNFRAGDEMVTIGKTWPSVDLKKVLVASEVQSHWRHSFTARYWIYDVETHSGQPLIPNHPEYRCSLAAWAPTSDSIAFVKDNNLYLRILRSDEVITVTQDGGTELFYGIPDWVYEEEVFAGNKALWWSSDGQHLAFLRTNETEVPEYPLQYFVSRPSGVTPPPDEKNYPELDFIKYPKAGAPNPTVDLQFFDVKKSEVFTVDIKDDFENENRLYTEVIWAGAEKVLIRETNRESDVLRMILIDVADREGKVVRELDVNALDGGWFEVSQDTVFVPADPANGRPHDGYVDTIIHEGFDHLAYFTPLDNNEPKLLTTGKWEVVNAPSAVDLKNNLVYFASTERSPIERHIYSVTLNGTDMKPLTDTSEDGRYAVSFSHGAQYMLLSYDGPEAPWQKVKSSPPNKKTYEDTIMRNEELAHRAKEYDLPQLKYQTVTIDGFELQVLERLPADFDPKKKYPVLFQVYGGPGSQQVSKSFRVDFQSYVAGTLGYIVVTVDGRGTGFIGREARCTVRGNLGYWEAHDQIETAKIWAAKPYVDASRIAIWGWSYGGFMTLKTLEQDAGETFSYGMAVAPVTDWRYYDSIYTERYMHMPQHNEEGYENATISDVNALANNVRFLIMHGVADDNVHFQNTLTLLDRFDLQGVENYDVHVFPDSDHSIYFHNANRMVYDRLEQWLIRAFNGEYLKLKDLKPIREDKDVQVRARTVHRRHE